MGLDMFFKFLYSLSHRYAFSPVCTHSGMSVITIVVSHESHIQKAGDIHAVTTAVQSCLNVTKRTFCHLALFAQKVKTDDTFCLGSHLTGRINC